MIDFQFVPEDITVTPGTTVRWTNEDFDAHDTISDDALWHSQYLGNGDTFEYTFTADRLEQLSYYCSIHGGMTGSVTVVLPEPSGIALVFVLAVLARHRGSAARTSLRPSKARAHAQR
jgi:hypothetical protein